MNDLLEQVRDWIGRRVAEGFDSDADILTASVEHFAEACDAKKLRPLAASCTAELAGDHRRRQDAWPETTDCDRIDAAFDDLEAGGLLVRQHFGCCAACAHDDVVAELDGQEGFAYYTRQDTEDAADAGRLLVAFGAASSGRRAACAVGQRVVAALRRAGLRADWDGDPARRVAVLGIDWKRRR